MWIDEGGLEKVESRVDDVRWKEEKKKKKEKKKAGDAGYLKQAMREELTG